MREIELQGVWDVVAIGTQREAAASPATTLSRFVFIDDAAFSDWRGLWAIVVSDLKTLAPADVIARCRALILDRDAHFNSNLPEVVLLVGGRFRISPSAGAPRMEFDQWYGGEPLPATNKAEFHWQGDRLILQLEESRSELESSAPGQSVVAVYELERARFR